jgi:hypothetical protein
LDAQGPSLNQGAESAICCLLTLLVVAEPREKSMETPAKVFTLLTNTPPTLSAAKEAGATAQ